MGCRYSYCRIEISFFRLKYLQYWNSRHIGSLLKVRHFETSAILKCPPSWMGGHIVFWSYCNLFSKWYLCCLVILLLTITINLSHSDNAFTWIAYFIISVVWRSSFKHVLEMPWCSSIYRLGIVISVDIWFDSKTLWWLWKDPYSVLVFVTGASRALVIVVRRAGLLLSQQDFEWRWSVPLFKCLTVLEFSFILFDLCLLITFFNFIMNYVPIVTFWIFTYHKIWILSIMFCFIWSYWIIYFLACL